MQESARVQLSRRRLLQSASAVITIGGVSLLAACQNASPAPTSVPAVATAAPQSVTSGARTALTIAPLATTTESTSVTPTAVPARATTPVAVAPAAGKQMYQEDAQHTGRS